MKLNKSAKRNSSVQLILFFLLLLSFYKETQAQTTVSLSSVADCQINQAASSTSYGANTTMDVKSWVAPNNVRALIKFDLSSIPAGATITSANLKLWETNTVGASRTINIHSINTSWSESTATWSNMASNYNGTIGASTNISWTGLFKQDVINVTSLVQGIVNGSTNNGWLLKDNVENEGGQYWQFATKEHGTSSKHPVLVITYTTAALNITVNPSSASICSGSSVSLTASGATNYSWSPSTGLNSTTSATVIANPATTTTYTVTGTTGSNTGTKTVTVTVNSSPVISISPSTAAICSGGNIQLTASGASTYSWSPATGLNVTNAVNPTASPAVSTTYTVVGTGSNGCTASASRLVTVNSNPTVNMANQSICNGQSTTFDAGAGFTTYLWNTGATTRTITTSASGTYSVTVTSNGCTGSGSATLTVNSNPTVSVANQTICSGLTATFDAGTGYSSYSWNTGATTRTITTGTAGTYTVTVTNGYNCSASASPVLTVNPLPTISVTPTSATILNGQNITLTASGGISYSWAPAAGLNSATNSIVISSPTATTTYTVTGTDANSCINTASSVITVSGNIMVQGNYAPLLRDLDNNVYKVKGSDLMFIYDEQYEVNDSAKLNYVIYDDNHNEVINGTTITQNAIYIKRGLNKCVLTCLGSKLNNSGIFILEITNTKNEKFYLRFSHTSASCH